MRIVIVGSGIAGLVAALELAGKHAVTLVTKSRLAESNTRYAQGGIAAVMTAEDSVAEHVQDTLRAGVGLCDPAAVEILCTEGPTRVRDLIALGVAFDRKNGELAQGREAAHSRARILHAGGDATGHAIEMALVEAVRRSAMQVLEHTFARDLALDRQGRTAGLIVRTEDGATETIAADAVILAAGGAGHLYPYTTNPSVATGDGIALALRAGAELADLEFYQFHPTALSASGGFLISEAVRGDGAVLRAADGTRFMPAVHPDAELAPRDVVARGIAEQMARQGGQPVLLDATGLVREHGPNFLAERFPTINAACQRAGLNWATQPVPVAPAAHYWMGGVRTDVYGRTSVPGLFAVGEVACTGVHGANRLASNSLLESLVFAWRAAELLATEGAEALRSWPVSPATLRTPIEVDPEPRRSTAPLPSREALQQVMWEAAGIVREEHSLRTAEQQLRGWRAEGSSLHDLETANLLLLAHAVVASALERCESRGAHFRLDYPETLEAERHHTLVVHHAPVAV